MAKGDHASVEKQIERQGQISQAGLNNVNSVLYNNNVPQSGAQPTGGGPAQSPPGGLPHQGQPRIGVNPAAPSSMNYQQQFNQWFPDETLTPDMIKAKEQELVAAGWKLRPNAAGVVGKVQTPDGQIIDVIQGASSGMNKRQWLTPDQAGPTINGNVGAGGGMSPASAWDMGNAVSGYTNFANTGGFSPEDLSNLRARAISPIRSIYSSAESGLNRQRALQGGYAPNYGAAAARMAREQSQGISDATTNAEASIAQAVQQGKLAGTQGLSNVGLATRNQMLQQQQLQNQHGLGMIDAEIRKSQVPTNYNQALGNIGSTLGLVGQVGGALGGLGGPSGGGIGPDVVGVGLPGFADPRRPR